MIWREFCKYGRRFRGLILLYVCWIALTTFLTATHQAFVSESAGMRRFAMEIKPHTTLVGIALLLVFLVALWLEDSIWKPRPISTRDQITAKVLWWVLLGGLLPALSGMLTTFTAQMGWAETWAFGALQGLFYLALGGFVSNLLVISKRWEEIGINLVMHLPILLLHGFCWAALGSGLLGWLTYLALVVTSFGIVLAVSLRKEQQIKSVVSSLIALFIIGALIAISLPLPWDRRSKNGNTSETLAMHTVDGEHLMPGPWYQGIDRLSERHDAKISLLVSSESPWKTTDELPGPRMGT